MPVKPEVQDILDMINATQVHAAQLTPTTQRQRMNEAATILTPEAVGTVVDQTIPGPGGSIGLRCYTPAEIDTDGQRPLLIWFHGGGYVVGNLDTADAVARLLTNATGAVVVSVDYRLAPEHPFPAAVDDALAAVSWVAEHAGGLGADPDRLAVAGESAGATLATVVCQQLRDTGPSIRAQLLICPLTDWHLDSPSIRTYAEGYYNTEEALRWDRRHYLGDDERLYDDPRASPILAPDSALAGLPPTMIITAEYDPVRDEGEAYGKRLESQGVETVIRRFNGMVHGFFALRYRLPDAATAIDGAAAFIRQSYAQHTTSRP